MVKVYGSDSDTEPSANGSAPDGEEPEEEYKYDTLFDAPNFADFITIKPNSRARSYEKRVQSMMKAGLVMSMNAKQYPDAATFLKHGPGFAKAAGNLAAENPRAAGIIDMLTSPESPALMFALVAIPLVAQLARNHQEDFRNLNWRERRAARKQAKLSGAVPTKPPITVHLGKRAFKIPIRFRFRMPNVKKMFSAFLAPTQHPGEIAQEVFSDETVVKALHKMGLFPREEPDEQQQ